MGKKLWSKKELDDVTEYTLKHGRLPRYAVEIADKEYAEEHPRDPNDGCYFVLLLALSPVLGLLVGAGLLVVQLL